MCIMPNILLACCSTLLSFNLILLEKKCFDLLALPQGSRGVLKGRIFACMVFYASFL